MYTEFYTAGGILQSHLKVLRFFYFLFCDDRFIAIFTIKLKVTLFLCSFSSTLGCDIFYTGRN